MTPERRCGMPYRARPEFIDNYRYNRRSRTVSTIKLPVIACCAPLAAPALAEAEAEATAALFRSLSDPARVRIVNLLARSPSPVCVCELVTALGLSQPTVSYHLKRLHDAGLLKREQRAKRAYYSVSPEALERLSSLVEPDGGAAMTTPSTSLREEVRRHYAEAARSVATAASSGCGARSCCGETTTGGDWGEALYDTEARAELPAAALRASMGCGNPTAIADLRPGETVLDLGSGAGIDVILAAKRVGSTGRAFGVDMTEEMLALARANALEAGVENAIFLKGAIEAIPLPSESVDVIISNCVVNLSVDKPAVLREMARVLKPGGRLGLSDIVAEDRLTATQRAERGSYAGCIAGAMSLSEYERGLADAGFQEIGVTLTHQIAEGIHGATVKAIKGERHAAEAGRPVTSGAQSGCC